MKKRIIPICILLISFCFLALVGCGNDRDSADRTQLISETGHEGHDHGPGEHHDETAAIDSEVASDWCREHGVPESVCTICHPSLIAGFKESGDWCAGHDLPESHCRLCNPDIVFPREELTPAATMDMTHDEIRVTLNYRTNAATCATDGALIQFALSNTAEKSGIKVQSVLEARREIAFKAPAEIVFDETGISAVTISVPALVTEWLVSPGDRVSEGQALAGLQSSEMASLRSALLTSFAAFRVKQKELDRHTKLKERELISEADWDMQAAVTEKARAEYVGTRGLLLSAGLDESDIREILENDDVSHRFLLRAPTDGVIIKRSAAVGELQDAGRAFATIGDPHAMWIEAHLTERQMHDVALGHGLVFSSDGRGVNRVGGEIIWVSRFLDQHTRTGTVRARIIDPAHSLRAGEFGRVQIVHSQNSDIALVPKDAVQWEGCCNVVFVRETADRYRPRKVRLVGSTGPYYQVADGVQPGQMVVVDGAFLLKTELKKSSIGAGCCGLEPVG